MHSLLRELEEPCKKCQGKGYVESFSDFYLEMLEDLELRYPTHEQAMAIARDKYAKEISEELCPQCNGMKVVPSKNGQVLISHKDLVVEFLQKRKLI